MAFDFNQFGLFGDSFTPPPQAGSTPGANEAMALASHGWKPSPQLVTAPSSPLNKASVGAPSFFTPLPAVRRASAYRRNQKAGRTMPLKEAKSLSDVTLLQVEGSPSVELELDGGNASVSVTRRSKYWEYFADEDKQMIWGLADEMFQAYQSYSHGHYSLRSLARMGHPYGYGMVRLKSGQRTRRRVPRKYGEQSIGHVMGVRGSVPTLSVINRQSGLFMASWQQRRDELSDGYELKFFNTAKYAWYLAAGTGKMQPHGPWTQVATSYLRRLNSAHHKAVRRARHAALAMGMGADNFGQFDKFDEPN